MKKITLLILSLLYFSVGYSQILLEDFESDPASYSLYADGVTSVDPVSDPETNGTRGEVLKIITSTSGAQWQNAQVTLTNPLDLSTSEKRVAVDIYSTSAFTMLAKVDDSGNPAAASQKNHSGAGWETLTFDFTDGADGTGSANGVYVKLLFFPLRTAAGGWPGSSFSSTSYVDNITSMLAPPAGDSDATLSALTGGVTGFSSAITEYTVLLAAGSGVNDIPTLAATPTQSNATAVISQATEFPGDATVTVTSADGTTKIYTISYAADPNPTTSPSAPAQLSEDVLSVYSDTYTSVGGLDLDPFWSQATDAYEITVGSNNVLKYENLNYQGLQYATTDVSGMEYVHVDYYTNDATAFQFYLIAGGENLFDIAATDEFSTGSWVGIDIPLSHYSDAGRDLTQAFQFKTVGNGTIFLDNIYFWKEPTVQGTDATLASITSGGSEISGFSPSIIEYTIELASGTQVENIPTLAYTPADANATVVESLATSFPGTSTLTVTSGDSNTQIVYTINYTVEVITSPSDAPSAPTSLSENVVSLFSDTYTDISMNSWRESWSSMTGGTEETFADNAVKTYTNAGYAGITPSAPIDASGMEYISFDYWSSDVTSFKFKLESAGPEAHEVDNLLATNGSWNTITIDLTNYSNVDLSNISIIVLSAVGNANSFYIDNLYFWKAPTTTWSGSDRDFNNASNWSSGVVPGVNDHVIVPSDGVFDITEDLTVNQMSIAAGASIISDGTITGTITYTRNIPTTNWYLISSPVVGQDKDAFVTASNLATGQGANVGFSSYDNTSGAWSYYQSGSTGSGNFTQGQGHAVKLNAIGDVVFTGTFNAEDSSIPLTIGTNNGYNLIGNPYLASVSVSELLGQANIGELLSQSSVWLWDQASESYVVKNFVADIEIAPGQAFFVLANTAGNFGITESMQSHSSDTFQRTTSKPEVVLSLSNGKASRTASVFYIDGATTSFDNGYDSSVFGGFSDNFSVFTHVVANGSGRNLGIQSLPKGDYQNMIVPIGVIAESGSNLEFSAKSENLPEGINLFLEDREESTFTRLDELNAAYKITTASAMNGVGRFYLHTTQSVLNTTDAKLDNVSVFKVHNSLRIVGLQQGKAAVKLFNVLGRQVLNTAFESNGTKDISLPSLAKGVYIVQLETAEGKLNKKIILE
jgi:hypothetical protein